MAAACALLRGFYFFSFLFPFSVYGQVHWLVTVLVQWCREEIWLGRGRIKEERGTSVGTKIKLKFGEFSRENKDSVYSRRIYFGPICGRILPDFYSGFSANSAAVKKKFLVVLPASNVTRRKYAPTCAVPYKMWETFINLKKILL